MSKLSVFAMITAMVVAVPLAAQDCIRGAVTFETKGKTQTLNLLIHERPIEVPKGLYNLSELPRHGGVFAVYPEIRKSRSLANSNVMAADMMSFDEDGRTLNLLSDTNGPEVDRMKTGDGLAFAAYLAGGTVEDMGFDRSTTLVDFVCLEAK